MSVARQRSRALVAAYRLSLERQLELRGGGLASSDEDLWRQVEELLTEGGAEETRCLGLDALAVMEDAMTTASGRRVWHRGGMLRGLAKAFQVLEQAAVNLYLGPWRDEYKVIKTYSGTFTHFIASVLSPPQILHLFGLLGYRLSSSRIEQLHLQSPPAGGAEELLRLSCAFLVARCECCLLLAALGKHSGDAEWELSVVRERKKGHSLQVAMENTAKSLVANPPLDDDEDIYCDDSGNGVQQEAPLSDQVKPDGVASSPSPEPNTSRSSSAERQERRRPCGESRPGPDGDRSCSCLLDSSRFLKRCLDCGADHDVTCASLDVCCLSNHRLTSLLAGDEAGLRLKLCGGVSPPRGFNLNPASSPSDPPVHPISFHECCDFSKLDPQLLCHTCSVFHAASCRQKEACQAEHDTRRLGTCSCGRPCSRKPLVLCRYCGNEFCNDCWYRHVPITCSCGQTFDQSSSV